MVKNFSLVYARPPCTLVRLHACTLGTRRRGDEVRLSFVISVTFCKSRAISVIHLSNFCFSLVTLARLHACTLECLNPVAAGGGIFQRPVFRLSAFCFGLWSTAVT